MEPGPDFDPADLPPALWKPGSAISPLKPEAGLGSKWSVSFLLTSTLISFAIENPPSIFSRRKIPKLLHQQRKVQPKSPNAFYILNPTPSPLMTSRGDGVWERAECIHSSSCLYLHPPNFVACTFNLVLPFFLI